MGDFLTAGKADDVKPGQMAAFDVKGKRIAVANVGGTYYAFDDTCTHRACSLAEGDLTEVVVTCGCHFSEFDITSGAVVTGPATLPLGTYSVRVQGQDLQVES